EQVTEFKTMVRNLHAAGLEVILDVVYNHTAEGGAGGPTLCFRGIDNEDFYRLDPTDLAKYADYTGTGNTVDTRQPAALRLIMDSLRYWVTEMHVDGFRFDLASALARRNDGFDPLSAFFAVIDQDPVLSAVKLIAEPWDSRSDGYQLGRFPPRWSEWNDRYRDSVRDFWRGHAPSLAEMGYRLTGSSDFFGPDSQHRRRSPQASVNFVTAHDGFTLRDLVSYDRKHNLANGEGGGDGTDNNRSWNCGSEGGTADPAVLAVRRRQQRNLLATLLLSQGVPMLLAGDELNRTQRGNNNAYCHDSALSWVDWSPVAITGPTPNVQSGDAAVIDQHWGDVDLDLREFTRRLIALRRTYPQLRRSDFLTGQTGAKNISIGRDQLLPDVAWFSPQGTLMSHDDWASGAQT
ncbi:MAG: glycogen debranching protein, partial [Pseudonocardiaceae bacterium]